MQFSYVQICTAKLPCCTVEVQDQATTRSSFGAEQGYLWLDMDDSEKGKNTTVFIGNWMDSYARA